jgi:DNA-binding response OmpR family regulator
MRILLVEDEPRAAQMLAKGLREQRGGRLSHEALRFRRVLAIIVTRRGEGYMLTSDISPHGRR